MTIYALILINAALGAAVVYGIVLLLSHGIRADRPSVEPVSLPLRGHREQRRAA